MRVISGHFKGRRLLSASGMTTRPTADRIRESIFNIIGPRLMCRHVLDLFAGTGAMGIEALSRGAESAVFVEMDKAALGVLRKNIAALGIEDRCRVIPWDIRKSFPMLFSGTRSYELVFMDPPYNVRLVLPTLTAVVSSGILAPGARLVAEHSRKEPIHPVPDGLVLSDQRKFGKTLVSFLDAVI
ncbi:16S rRNA (guanine(966)-N(2))-methyltransferase RsmD [Desulfosarcina sp. OttesenSCG-928-A07]|nr:16S rRNA (guanine(966)-N(2))-methyltransferase RsmD [Desulfosarcina sp. OttesenSCG-928-A07]